MTKQGEHFHLRTFQGRKCFSGENGPKTKGSLSYTFLVCKVDLTGRTRGTYSYIWDVAERFWPQVFENAQDTTPLAARQRIREQLQLFGLEPTAELEQKLFLWR